MNFDLNSKIRRIRAATYDVTMATAYLMLYWSAMTGLKLYDVVWRFRKMISNVAAEPTRLDASINNDNVTNLRPIDDHRV